MASPQLAIQTYPDASDVRPWVLTKSLADWPIADRWYSCNSLAAGCRRMPQAPGWTKYPGYPGWSVKFLGHIQPSVEIMTHRKTINQLTERNSQWLGDCPNANAIGSTGSHQTWLKALTKWTQPRIHGIISSMWLQFNLGCVAKQNMWQGLYPWQGLYLLKEKLPSPSFIIPHHHFGF